MNLRYQIRTLLLTLIFSFYSIICIGVISAFRIDCSTHHNMEFWRTIVLETIKMCLWDLLNTTNFIKPMYLYSEKQAKFFF